MTPCFLISVGATVLWPAGAPEAFTFEDPKKVNSVQWAMDSPLEPIAGSAQAIGGTVSFDPEHPERSTGTITIPTSSVVAPVAMMTTHLQSEKWLDAAKYPTIEFVIERVTLKSRSAIPLSDPHGPPPRGTTTYWVEVDGTLSLHGVKAKRTVSAEVAYTPGGLATKMRGVEGDVLRVRTAFSISRKEFGIDGGSPLAVVGDTIDIRVAVAAIRKT